MQDDSHNLFTLILAGQMELAKRLEHPRRANLYQRIGTYCRIEKIESLDQLREYVQTRLRLAGAKQMFFNDIAIEALWRHSERGVPRLVNKLCGLCMKAGETNGFSMINDEVVNQIGERFERITGAARHKTKHPAQVEHQSHLTEPSERRTMAAPDTIIEEMVEETPQVISALEPGQQASVEQIERLTRRKHRGKPTSVLSMSR